MADPIEQFRSAIAAAGLPPPDTINADGVIHRFSTNGKRSDDSGWYALHLDGVPAGSFGCWRAGFTQNWCGKPDSDMTATEREAHRTRLQAMKAQRDIEQVQRNESAAVGADSRFKTATACTSHPYLTTKGVQAHGVKADGDKLLIPVRDVAGTLHSLQTIAPDGDKRFHPGGRVKGCYHSIGTPDKVLIVCEGYATGASIHEATGDAVAVAFNAGNLEPVAVALRTKYPALKIIIAADDDYQTDGNPGMTKARAAAQAVGGFLAVPVFPEGRPDKATDFNDLHQIAGADAVKACIDAATSLDKGSTDYFKKNRIVLTCGSDLTPEPVQWLWTGWLALGKFHLLAGAPGQGKTTIAMGLAATVTIAGRWPDGTRCEAGNVLIWSGEDDYADTLLPRLIAAGADRSRIYFVGGTRVGSEVRPFDPATDTPILQDAIAKIGSVSLIVIDPVSTAVSGDSHKNTEVRRGLQPLVDLAASINAALLGITHLSKGGQGSDPAQRVIGSIAFTAVARVVMLAARVKADAGDDKRILARGKSNIGPDNGGFEYHLAQVEALPGINASRIEWGQAVEGTAQELLTDPAEQDAPDQADAVSLLRAELTADCLTSANLAIKPLKDAGFSKKQIWTASKKLKVIRRKGSDGKADGWYWRLPGTVPEDSISREGSQDSPFSKQEPWEPSAESSRVSSTLEPSAVELL